jgi:CO/xanthine dehydrogenase Mo-binding subunit
MTATHPPEKGLVGHRYRPGDQPQRRAQQVEGCVVDALSTAQRKSPLPTAPPRGNFDSYGLLRIPQAPRWSAIHPDKPHGNSAAPIAPATPAIANAISRPPERIRTLPFRRSGSWSERRRATRRAARVRQTA